MSQRILFTYQTQDLANNSLNQLLGCYANGHSPLTAVSNGSANINFVNTASVTVALTANGPQTNVALTAVSATSNGVFTGPSWVQVGQWVHQWGESSPGGGSPQMVTFPTPFPNACQSVICIPFALNETIFILNVSSTAFNVSVGATGQAFMWQADGH
jgi:hypothetical protein